MDQKRQSSVQFKRRWLILKTERRSIECASEIREGDTYASNIGQEKKTPDIVEIPSAIDNVEHVTGEVSHVIFDLETGGFSRTSDILQISVHGDNQFNRYVTSTQKISKWSSNITKLTENNGQLFHDGKAVTTISVQDAMFEFIAFLKTVKNPVLVGHNI